MERPSYFRNLLYVQSSIISIKLHTYISYTLMYLSTVYAVL